VHRHELLERVSMIESVVDAINLVAYALPARGR
jgi:hypothetical protein